MQCYSNLQKGKLRPELVEWVANVVYLLSRSRSQFLLPSGTQRNGQWNDGIQNGAFLRVNWTGDSSLDV